MAVTGSSYLQRTKNSNSFNTALYSYIELSMMMHINAENLEETERWVGVRARAAEGLANDGVDPDYRDKRNLE